MSDLDIIYLDEAIIVCNKPAGLLSVPGKKPEDWDSLITRVQQRYPAAKVVHRLDCHTSGLMVIALNLESERWMHAQFRERKVYKRYIAECAGRFEAGHGKIELPLICDWPNRPKQMVCYERGKQALTRFTVLGHYHDHARVALEPVTGRSHQLRVHMAAIGHPILGDPFYAPPAVEAMAPRLLLHAFELGFYHPTSGIFKKFKTKTIF